jgi:hypothetical protein
MGRSHFVNVPVDVDDLLSDLSDSELREVFEAHFPREKVIALQGMGDGDKPLSRTVEDAYLAAKALPDCPQPIRDLLWRVHGRAI